MDMHLLFFFPVILLVIVGIFAKRYNFYFLGAAIGIAIILVAAFHGSYYSPGTDNYGLENRFKIIEHNIDNRGLTSIVYVKGADTMALDYLTPKQLDSVISKQ